MGQQMNKKGLAQKEIDMATCACYMICHESIYI